MQEESQYSRRFGNDISHLHAFPPSLPFAIFVSQSFSYCQGSFVLCHAALSVTRNCWFVHIFIYWKTGRRRGWLCANCQVRKKYKVGFKSRIWFFSGDDGSCRRRNGSYLNHVHLVLPFDKLTRDKQRGLDGTAFGEVGMDADKGQNGGLEFRRNSTSFQRCFPPSSWIAPIIFTFGCQDSVVSLSPRVDMDLKKSRRTFKKLFCPANDKHIAMCI